MRLCLILSLFISFSAAAAIKRPVEREQLEGLVKDVAGLHKALVDLGDGRSLLQHCLDSVARAGDAAALDLAGIVVVVPPDPAAAEPLEPVCRDFAARTGVSVDTVPGGAERADSVGAAAGSLRGRVRERRHRCGLASVRVDVPGGDRPATRHHTLQGHRARRGRLGGHPLADAAEFDGVHRLQMSQPVDGVRQRARVGESLRQVRRVAAPTDDHCARLDGCRRCRPGPHRVDAARRGSSGWPRWRSRGTRCCRPRRRCCHRARGRSPRACPARSSNPAAAPRLRDRSYRAAAAPRGRRQELAARPLGQQADRAGRLLLNATWIGISKKTTG
mgnify:CR=1 FL=1